MKKLLLLLLLVPLISFGQTKEGLQLCLAMQSNNFMSETEAENALDRILNTIGVSKNFILVPCGEISNAAATSYKGIRYILYDKEFMQLINSRTNDWASLAILAHEVGHHINGHTLDITMYAGGVVEPKSLEIKRKQELEADEFAGFVLARLGASLNNALSFTSIFSDKDDSYSTHPSKSKRINAIRKGYNKAGGNSSVANTNNTPTEYTRKNTNMSVEEYINRGIERRDSNNYKAAISDFTAAIRIKPKYGFAYYLRASAKSKLKDYYGTIKDLSKSIELNPDFSPQYNNRGNAKSKLKDYYGAIDDYSKAIEINPDDINAYINRGSTKSDLKDYYGAIDDFSKAIEINPYNSMAYSNRGSAKTNLKDYYGGISDLNKAIEINPDYSMAYSTRGSAKFGLKDNYGAIKDFSKAIDLRPDNFFAYYMRGYTKYKLKDYYGAIDDCSKAIEINPDDINAYTIRGSAETNLEDYTGACADFKKAISLGGTNNVEWFKEYCN